MRIYRLVTTAISGTLLAGVSTAAFAGCGGNVYCGPRVMAFEGVPSVTCNTPRPAPSCNPGVTLHHGGADRLAPIGAYSTAPFGYLKTVEYKNTPNVNIMRIRSRAPMISLNDRPSAFTGGCNPASTTYCRAGQGRPVSIALSPAPVIMAPAPRVVAVGGGYNPANAAPRQYGSLDFVPGIAHVPTSIIDRSPITHIDGVPQPQVRSVTTAAMSRPVMNAPAYRMPIRPTRPMGGNVLGHVNAGSYTYQPEGGGAYWEKTSGATIVDGLPATQILCRRQAPRPAPVTVNVVRPVIGVPRPVATPVPVNVGCAPAPMPMMAGARGGNSRYGSRWNY